MNENTGDNELENLRLENDRLVLENNKLTSKNKELTAVNNNLNEKILDRFKKRDNNSQDIIDKLERTVAELEEERAKSQDIIDKLERTVAELEEERAKSQGTIDKLERTVAELEEERAKIKDTIVLNREVEELQRERKQIQNALGKTGYPGSTLVDQVRYVSDNADIVANNILNYLNVVPNGFQTSKNLLELAREALFDKGKKQNAVQKLLKDNTLYEDLEENGDMVFKFTGDNCQNFVNDLQKQGIPARIGGFFNNKIFINMGSFNNFPNLFFSEVCQYKQSVSSKQVAPEIYSNVKQENIIQQKTKEKVETLPFS